MALVYTPDGRQVVVPDYLAPQQQVTATEYPLSPIALPPPPPPPPPPIQKLGPGFGSGQEVAAPLEQGPASVTGGALPAPGMEATAPSPPVQNSPDFTAGTVDTSDKAVAKGNKEYERTQRVAAAQQAARDRFAASPEGQHQAAVTAGDKAFGDLNAANADVAAIDSAAAGDKYAALSDAQTRADAIDQERQRVAVERQKVRDQKQQQVDLYVHDADNFKIDENKFWGDASTAKNIGRVIAMAMTGVGMALQGRGHEQNPVIAMFDSMAKQSIQMQMDKRAQLEKRAERAGGELDKFDRISDSTDARYNAEMARAYDRGMRQGDLAVAKYGDKRAEANWKVQRADLEQKQAEYKDKAANAAFEMEDKRMAQRNARAQVGIAAGHLALAGKQFEEGKRQFDENLKREDTRLAIEAGKLEQAGNQAGAKQVLEQGVAAPPQAVQDPDTGEVTINRDSGLLKNANDQPWIIPTVDEAKDFRKKKAASDSLVNILDEIRSIRDKVGGESEWGNSPEYQRLQVLKQNLVLLKKQGTQGMSSDADMARIEKALGAANPASFRSQAASLDEGREQVVKQLNTEARALGYTGKDIAYADPLSMKASLTPQQGAATQALTAPSPAQALGRGLGLGARGGEIAADLFSELSPEALRAKAAGQSAPAQVPQHIRQTIDTLAATLNAPGATPYAREQASALLQQLSTDAEDPGVRAYAKTQQDQALSTSFAARTSKESP
jgi:hypothetical protein